ncbi:MAG: hypothetical protein ACE366_08455 [Bradymonadia bacterium]
MSDEQRQPEFEQDHEIQHDDDLGTPETRRAYEKPGFVTSVVFERAALSCGALNITPGPPPFGCNLQS